MNEFKDLMYRSIEEYSDLVRRKHPRDLSLTSDAERKGIFYTIVRRNIMYGTNLSIDIKCKSLKCRFDKEGYISSISTSFSYSGSVIKDYIDLIFNNRHIIYPFKGLNEMYDIISSLK